MLTESVREEGVAELWGRIEEHRAHLEGEGQLEERRSRNLASEVFAVASMRVKTHLEQAVADDEELQRVLEAVQERRLDPLSAVREIMERVFLVEAGEGSRSDLAGRSKRRSAASDEEASAAVSSATGGPA